ncbi:transposon Ty3-I Gag-Pol polyprotein [Trichonephila clavipes]|nr:transposon Ty3-I Gag-Pol polyprotein [Trichonephila clavipes]
MDEYMRSHKAHLIDKFLESDDIRRINWPSRSPDLKPIENVWEALGTAIATHNSALRTIQGLKTEFLNE